MRVRTALVAFAVPILLLAPTATAEPLQAATLSELDTSFTLDEGTSFQTYTERIDAISGLAETVGIEDAFADPNRTGVASGTGSCPSDIGISGATWFCWQGAENDPPNGDAGTEDWYPQGISGDWDAEVAGTPPTQGIIVSWYDNTDAGKGTRVSLVDASDPNNVQYRHAILVEPTSGNDFDSIHPLHAGGVAWVGNYLYVVDTDHGIRVFDLTHVWRTEPDSSESLIGNVDGKFYAYNYAYAIPQVGSYTQDQPCERPADSPTTDPLCFSSVSVDHSTNPPSLLTGEFYYDQVPGARMARWPIDTATGRLVTAEDGTVTSDNVYQTTHTSVQGSASNAGTFWLHSSAGDHGELHTTRVGEEGTTAEVPAGPEDFSYQPATGELWSLSEHPDIFRAVYAIPTN